MMSRLYVLATRAIAEEVVVTVTLARITISERGVGQFPTPDFTSMKW